MPLRRSLARIARITLVMLVAGFAAQCGGGSDTTAPPPPSGTIAVSIVTRVVRIETGDSVIATIYGSWTGSASLTKLKVTSTGAIASIDSQLGPPSAPSPWRWTKVYTLAPLAAPDSLILNVTASGTVAPATAHSADSLDASPLVVIPSITITPGKPRSRDPMTVHVTVASTLPVDSVEMHQVGSSGYFFSHSGGQLNFVVDFPDTTPDCNTGLLDIGVSVFSGAHRYNREIIDHCWIHPTEIGASASDDANPWLIAGDHLHLTVTGVKYGDADGAPVTWTGYSLGPPLNKRDSVAGSGPAMFDLTSTAGWMTGPTLALDSNIKITAFVRDSVGYYDSAQYATVKVVDAVRHTMSTLPIKTRVLDAFYDAKRGQILLAEPDSQSLAVIDLSSWTYLTPVPVIGNPVSFDMTPSGDTIVVGHENTVQLEIIPLNGGLRQEVNIPMPAGRAPSHVRVLNGKAFAVSAGDGAMFEIDLTTLAVRRRPDAGDSGTIGAGTNIARSFDRKKMFVFSRGYCCPIKAQMYDAVSDSFGPYSPEGTALDESVEITMSGDGSRIGISNHVINSDLSDASPRFDPDQYMADEPYSRVSGISFDGSQDYVRWPVGFFRYRVSDGAAVELVRLPVAYAQVIAGMSNRVLALPDGHTVIVIMDTAVFKITLP